MKYFNALPDLALTAAQKSVGTAVRQCVADAAPKYVAPKDTFVRISDDRKLELVVRHGTDRHVEIRMHVDRDGRLDLSCPALHEEFSLCFNDVWEPNDCVGDLAMGLQVIRGLLEGRLERVIIWGRGAVAKSIDVLVHLDGSREALDRSYGLAGLVGSIVSRRRETRRVSFTA